MHHSTCTSRRVSYLVDHLNLDLTARNAFGKYQSAAFQGNMDRQHHHQDFHSIRTDNQPSIPDSMIIFTTSWNDEQRIPITFVSS